MTPSLLQRPRRIERDVRIDLAAEAFMLMHILENAASAQLRALAASGGRVIVADDALASMTHRQWVGDGAEWDGDAEWPALLRRADRLSPGFRD